jgi:hypothetical protein
MASVLEGHLNVAGRTEYLTDNRCRPLDMACLPCRTKGEQMHFIERAGCSDEHAEILTGSAQRIHARAGCGNDILDAPRTRMLWDLESEINGPISGARSSSLRSSQNDLPKRPHGFKVID